MPDRQRLPMPGEKPISVWQPRKHKSKLPWGRIRLGFVWRILPWLAVVAVLVITLMIWRTTGKSVTVVINGQPHQVKTHRRSVEGALRTAGIRPDDTVYLDPPADLPLEHGMVITVASLRPVLVHNGDQTLVAHTRSIDPAAIVDELGIVIGPDNGIRIERAARPTAEEIIENPALADVALIPRELRIVPASMVIVNEVQPDGTQTRVSFQTTARSLGEALAMAGYGLYEADQITPPPGTAISDGMEVTIERAAPVSVYADGRLFVTRSRQPTVAGLLADLGLALTGQDYVLPAPDQPLRAGDRVQLVRVTGEQIVEESPVPFTTSYVPDPDLELDQQRILQEGQEGVLHREIAVRLEDGLEVSRVVQAEWVAEQPQPRVVAYGTRIVFHTLETPGGPIQYWRVLHMLATSYSPSTAGHKQPGDPFFGLSATGAEVVRGIVATDPRVVGLGTRLYVPGYGLGQALDVGGAVKGMRVDLGYDDQNLVLWNNWVDVYLLPPVPPPDEMIWVLPE